MKVVFTALFAIAIAFAFAQPAVSTPATAYKEKVIYSFGPDAGSPVGVIKAKGASALYGAACCGANHGGMIYSLDLKTDAQTVLYSFCGQANCTDGAIANSPMREIGGLLYGTTQSGGAEGCGFMDAGCGVLFSLDPGTGTEKVLYTFCSQQNCADGAYPSPDLLMVNNLLYGTTVDGGDTSCGPGCGTAYSSTRRPARRRRFIPSAAGSSRARMASIRAVVSFMRMACFMERLHSAVSGVERSSCST